MISNDERREVAARLRKDDVSWNVVKADIDTYRNYLADLIEPEPERTCRYEHIEGTWYKTSCGERYDGIAPPSYCPNCGAKVV